MNRYIPIVQIVISVLLVIAILLQQKGSGLSAAFGGEGGVIGSRRGAEKGLFIATIVLSAIFLGLALTNVLIR